MKYLIWLLALSLALPARAQKVKFRKGKAMAETTKSAQPQEPVLVFQRTPCHGTCPTYTATVFADGRVAYDGQRFVSLLGQHTLSLPVATVNELLTEAKRIDFNKFRERYSGNTADLPASIITVHPAGQPLKAVYAEENVPESLEKYIKLVASKLDPLATNLLDR